MLPWYRSWGFWQPVVLVAAILALSYAHVPLWLQFAYCMLAFGAGHERAAT